MTDGRCITSINVLEQPNTAIHKTQVPLSVQKRTHRGQHITPRHRLQQHRHIRLLAQSTTMSRRTGGPDKSMQNQATLKSLVKLEGNKSCADCKKNKRRGSSNIQQPEEKQLTGHGRPSMGQLELGHLHMHPVRSQLPCSCRGSNLTRLQMLRNPSWHGYAH